MSIKTKYASLMKTWGIGYSAILGRVQGIINVMLLASTYLIAKGFELSFTESIMIGIGLIIFVMVSGYFYIKLGMQKAEASANFVENPELHEMSLRIKRIEDKLDLLAGAIGK